MTKATVIVKNALFHVGAHSEYFPADPEILEATREALNDLLNELAIDLNITVQNAEELADDIREPAGAKADLEYMLAERAATIAQMTIPPDTLRLIRKAARRLKKRFFCDDTPNITPSRLLPKGAGNPHSRSNRAFFNGQALDDDTSTST